MLRPSPAVRPVIEIVPAILVYTREELQARLDAVGGCPILQLDLMDGRFVNNATIGLEALQDFKLPPGRLIEYHLMVSDPLRWIERLPARNPTIFQVLNGFMTVDLSAFYADVSKDCLYTFAPRSRERRSWSSRMPQS